jgi:hypothetical protein
MKAQIVQPEVSGVPGMAGPLAERSLVTEWEEIPLEGFRNAFSVKAGSSWPRVEKIFVDYGPVLSVAVASALVYAEEAGKLGEYLDKLDKHYKDDLSYQHPELRGRLIITPAEKNRSLIFVESLICELKPELFR